MLTGLIFDWARRTPDRTAVIHDGRRHSYREFARMIAVARGSFAARGYTGSGYAVLAFSNMLDFWVYGLALRSLGLTTVAVPSVPALSALGLGGIRCVIGNRNQDWPDLERLCTERFYPLLPMQLGGAAPLELDSSYPQGGHILFSSGTTGDFKMVLMTPEIDAVFLRRKADLIGMDRDTVLCVFNFPGWSGIGYRWAASPWIVGGATLIEHGSQRHRALLRPGITHAVITPAVLDAVLEAPADAFPRNDGMMLAVGGGAMTRNHVVAAKARITTRLYNFLGSTEAGGIAHTVVETEDDRRWHKIAPGRVVEIVDEEDRPVPMGETGRLRVGTEGGPTSYLQNEAASREFFANGFFYPGDLAVLRSDGRMALQGRVTDVINARGTKISPAPIEDKLSEALGLRGVCLFSMQNDGGEEELHVVVESPKPIDEAQLIAALQQELRGFPRVRVHTVAELPRNRMGKLLRQVVRAQALAKGTASLP